MRNTTTDGLFPPHPVESGSALVPIKSWADMFLETEVTGIEFDAFWYRIVEGGAGCYFRRMGVPRCTVLVLWNVDGPELIECRASGNRLLAAPEDDSIVAQVTQLFLAAGYFGAYPRH